MSYNSKKKGFYHKIKNICNISLSYQYYFGILCERKSKLEGLIIIDYLFFFYLVILILTRVKSILNEFPTLVMT